MNHVKTQPQRPYDVFRRRSKMAWSTVSKADERSNNVSTVRSPSSGPRKLPEQTGVCTATRTAVLPHHADWHAMRTLAAATDSRLLYTVHWKLISRLKLLRGEKIFSPWYIFIGGMGAIAPLPPWDRRHCMTHHIKVWPNKCNCFMPLLQVSLLISALEQTCLKLPFYILISTQVRGFSCPSMSFLQCPALRLCLSLSCPATSCPAIAVVRQCLVRTAFSIDPLQVYMTT